MKTITDDYEGFLEDGGWKFLEEVRRRRRFYVHTSLRSCHS
jgi:hypothetical protein